MGQRLPVRRKLWQIPSEDDDMLVDEDLYREMLQDRRQEVIENRLHKRRVKRALQRLGTLKKSKRHRHEDDYCIVNL